MDCIRTFDLEPGEQGFKDGTGVLFGEKEEGKPA